MKQRKNFIVMLLIVVMCMTAFSSFGTVFAAEAHSEIDYGYPYYNGWDGSDYATYLKDVKIPIFHADYVNAGSYAKGNEESQNYDSWRRYAHVINAYLTTYNNNLMTVQATKNGTIGIEYYKTNGTFISSKVIKQELPIFGGFLDYNNYYYVVTGQDNLSESNSTEVIRVTKYDKNWKKIGSCGLFGINTTKPFNAGTLRFATDGKYIVVRTAHSMYALKGVNHQANLTFEFDSETMKITDEYSGMYSNNNGYVSHSFNQFVQIENHKLVAVDHGDAAPTRGMVLMNYNGTVNDGTFNEKATYSTLMSFAGTYEVNGNDTGATIGAFEISSTSYLVAGTKDNALSNQTYGDIIVIAKNKSTNKVVTNKIATYTTVLPSTPHLVKIKNNSYLLMWGIENTVHYVMIDGNGNKVGKEYSMKGNLSECVPLVLNNKVTWYVRNYLGIIFYQIDLSTLSGNKLSNLPYKANEWIKYKNPSNGQLTDNLIYVDKNNIIDESMGLYWRKNNKGKWVEYSNTTKLNTKDVKLSSSQYSDYNTYCIANQWAKIADKWYFFDKSGYMAHKEWINGYWVNPNGTQTYKYRGSWRHNANGWWYGDTSGWYVKNEWQKIDGKWYYFSNGYMKTGWLGISGNKYYLNTNGTMQTGWKKIDGNWYYFGSNGIALTNTTKKIQGKSYKFNTNGVCLNP